MVLNDPADLVRLLVIAAIVYPALVMILRVSGKRTLSKLNAFDFVVTVALGSTLATIMLSRDVSLTEGILALALLVALQYAVALLAVRWPPSQKLLKARPTMLLRDGQLRSQTLRSARVAESEIRQAARSQGAGDLHDLAAVVLETDGSLSVISRSQLGDGSTLADVRDEGGGRPVKNADEAGRPHRTARTAWSLRQR
ncbi:DUF421 domain-containing protein [Solwaraspora sp. WMMD791]|uniref:DUF421 domain-containing protein n=1 Tax=Solwaraspora sp. WMMD791 TaxID=3016086 RepID=UPI00249A1AFA|nr:YetF domain-containing protein [Solwaraspora sp. WMMD791]WFE24872.1 DUF421 domain-containing protein [Solwaraspora sp. WMMD791]